MAAAAILGAIIGIAVAYWVTRSKKSFRAKLLEEIEKHSRTGTAARFIKELAVHRYQWMKTFSLIRKPFSREINLTIETAALILSIVGLESSLANFDQRFRGPVEGIAVIALLGIVMAYIPSEWYFSHRIEADMDAVLQQMLDSADRGTLDDYVAEAKKSWVLD